MRFSATRSFCLTIAPLLLSICIASALLHTQNVPVIQVETHLIDITLGVHDAEGRVVPGLGQGDFTVIEDGIPQKIRFFAHDNQLPLSIGLIIDASGESEKVRQGTRKGHRGFPRADS